MQLSDSKAAQQFVELIRLPGAVHELRILTTKGIFGGYFDDPVSLVAEAQFQSGSGNVYMTLNPVHPDCRSRALNRTIWAGKNGLTKDGEITGRSRLLVDFDPVRLSGIPSTDAEHVAALELAQTVRQVLSEMGWSEPIATDSGNGAALLYGIDLATDDEGLVRRVLEELSKRFSTPAVKIDTSVHNASRITRVPGTLNMKGENLAERPHRLAGIVSAPATLEPVGRELLEQLIAPGSKAAEPVKVAKPAGQFDVAAWLRAKDMVFTEKSGQCHGLKGTWFTLSYCPFKGPQHTDGNTGIFQGDDGQIFAKCHHEKCANENWRTMRRLLDPDFDGRTTQAVLDGSLEGVKDPHRLARAVLEHFAHPEHRTLILNKGSIYRWDGVWTLQDDDSIKLLIWRVVREEFEDFARKMQKAGKTVQMPSVSTNLVNNVLGALRSMIEVTASVGDWLVGEGPAVGDMLICKNGILDLRRFVAGESDSLIDHTPRLFVQNKLDFDFDKAPAPPARWHQFLQEVWPDDLESRLLLQQFFGYSLTSDVSKQKFLMLLGATRGGKGVITRLLSALVGKENVCSIRLGRLADRFGLENAVGKSLILIPDANMPRTDKAAECVETLKALTGGDILDIDRKNRPVISTAIPAKVVISSNHMIDLPDHSRALYERTTLLLFSNSFAKTPDTELDAKLKRELPGLLLWAIEGWKSLREKGRFIEPESSRALKNTLQESASPIHAFIAECCVVSKHAKADKDELFQAWQEWCQSHEQPKSDKNLFARLLFAAQPQIKNARPTIDGQRVRLYSGIALRESDLCPENPMPGEASFTVSDDAPRQLLESASA